MRRLAVWRLLAVRRLLARWLLDRNRLSLVELSSRPVRPPAGHAR